MMSASGPLGMANFWDGRSLVVRMLLLLLRCAVSGKLSGLAAGESQALLCYKESCRARTVTCRWKPENASKANYTLKLRYQDETMNESFQAGESTSFSFDQNKVSALNNVTIWVENYADGLIFISEKRMLQISEAVKFNAPASKNIIMSKVNGILTLKWPEPNDCPPIKTEARTWHSKDAKWTSGSCDSEKEAGGGSATQLVVLCHVDKNMAQEVQIRYRTSHWSSHWSDWSESIMVPAEIHESPYVTYTVGQLGRDGLRNLTLEWEKPSMEQGEVEYRLAFILLPCNCKESVYATESHRTSYKTALSGAGYNISLQASNKAGSPPPYTFHLPPAQQQDSAPGLPFLNSSLSGKRLTVQWPVKTSTEIYCFEEQPLGEAIQEKPCTEEELDASTTGSSSGTLEPNRCYRLAVHTFNFEKETWSTFAFTHLFFRNTSLEDPIQVNVTDQTTNSAILWWDPPKALSACPNALKKYIICYRNEQARNMTYCEANASETRYTIVGLQPETTYRVGVWASTDEGENACQALQDFLTSPPEPKTVTLALSFWYLGIFGGLLTATSIFCLGKKRAKKVLCSALPDPANTEAVKIHTATETAQVQLQLRFLEPLESSSPTKPFLVELPSKEEPSANTKVNSLGCARAVEEFLPSKEDQVGSATVLPLEYNSQGLLNPADDDQQGQEGWGEFTGFSSKARAGGSLLSPNDVKVVDSTAPLQAPAPLSLMLLDTVVVTRDSGGGGSSGASA
ncbi:interleukin-12 receptor subunit beta-1 [Eublepharis macularius]|uniref:Interleukin-12 receptor subunit beta-1 n=1 Tax=Eublepharis macularius TaxID=481883 RepID=A0AA97JF82_EUBMA|nr:interleukin-12 receptor subunit beta-1 [Eublepharis macularius]